MPIPDFVTTLRRHIGHSPLWLPAVTAVVMREDDVLLVQRGDNLAWTPVTGIVDPGEQPAAAAAREVAEETGVVVEVETLAWVQATGLTVHANGDEVYYLDHLFRCRYLSGTAQVSDDENVDVAWVAVPDLPAMGALYLDRIACALQGRTATRFER
ncbi:NUDIX domain-containing protein [soil metagenome]